MAVKLVKHQKWAKNERPKQKRSLKLLYALLVALFLLPAIFLGAGRGIWGKTGKLSVVVATENGDVNVLTFDTENQVISTAIIPENTQIEAARGYGVWKVGSLYQLGDNEGLGGRLLAESVTKSLKIPVDAWAGEGAIGFTSPNPIIPIITALRPLGSNLKLKDRLQIAIFSSSIKSANKITLDLVDTGYLQAKVLSDGSHGYTPKSTYPRSLYSLYADPQISDESLSIRVVNQTGLRSASSALGKVVNVLGASVSAIENEAKTENDCAIFAKKTVTSIKLARIFFCDLKPAKEGIDVEIEIGETFLNRF